MARIEFPDGHEGEENLPVTQRSLKNCFKDDKGNILSLAGIQSITTTGKIARIQFEWNDSLYQVVSNDLIKITNKDTGAFSVIGTVSGTADIVVAIGFVFATLIVKGSDTYKLDKSDVLTNITAQPNMASWVDVTHMDGHFLFVPADGGPIVFSDQGDPGAIQAESFFDAESLSDINVGIAELRNTLYVFGKNSIEPYVNTGSGFQRIPKGRIDFGYIGGRVEYKDTILFLGREKDQDFGIYALRQGTAEKISNPAIDEILASYDSAQRATVISGRFKWGGYDFVSFELPDDSFVFRDGRWSITESSTNGTSMPWGFGFITQFEGEYFTAFQENIGKLAKINTHYGEPFERSIDLTIEQADNENFTCQSLKLGLSQGFNSSEGSVALQMSDDSVIYSQPLFRPTGKLGEYAKDLEWNYGGGLGMYHGAMGIKIRTFEDVVFSANSLAVDLR